jgi:hypothetical protein
MNPIAELTLSALRDLDVLDVPHYAGALVAACEKAPPPFGTREYGEIFREAAADADWLAASLVENAWGEGDGATRLWSLAASTPDPMVAAQVRQHAIDEARHARWYVAMLHLVFPNAVDVSQHAVLDALSPGYTNQGIPEARAGSPFAKAVTLDDLIQMNIAEVRTCVHHLLQRSMLVPYCAEARRGRLLPLLDSLLEDEKKHVAYTAKLIERYARNGPVDLVYDLTAERLRDFNAITNEDLGRRVFEST